MAGPRIRPKKSVRACQQWLHVHEDILQEIFHRLPLKSMVSCKIICKKWNSILSDPQFIKETINHRFGGNHHLMFINPNSLKLSMYTIGYENNNHIIHQSETSPFSGFRRTCNNCNYNKVTVLGTCNGLVALLIQHTFVLCNPLIGLCTTFNFDRLKICIYVFDVKFQVGLCYDASDDEYIVVNVFQKVSSGHKWDWLVSFKQGIDRWRFLGSVKRNTSEDFVEGIGKAFCGNSHWIHQGSRIIYFDAKEKSFNHMNFPGFNGDDRIMGFMDMDGEHQLGVVVGNTNLSSLLQVWVMKEYGNSEPWTRLFKLKINKTRVWNDKVLGHLELLSNRELLIEMGRDGLWVYDVERGDLRMVRDSSQIDFSKTTFWTTYKPSLVSVSCRRTGRYKRNVINLKLDTVQQREEEDEEME